MCYSENLISPLSGVSSVQSKDVMLVPLLFSVYVLPQSEYGCDLLSRLCLKVFSLDNRFVESCVRKLKISYLLGKYLLSIE